MDCVSAELSVCGARMVVAIRAALLKGRSSGDAVYAAAEDITTELKERIIQLHQIQKRAAHECGTGISPARVTYNLFFFEYRTFLLGCSDW